MTSTPFVLPYCFLAFFQPYFTYINTDQNKSYSFYSIKPYKMIKHNF